MIQIKSKREVETIIKELKEIQDRLSVCIDMDDEDMNTDKDAYNKVYEVIMTLEDNIENLN